MNDLTRRCAYLTMADLDFFVSDADLSHAPMRQLGWDVDMVPWNDPDVDWDEYDMVYICTPWDYQNDVVGFMTVLGRIEDSRALLVNDLRIVEWNLDKRYLRELEGKGAAIVPSRWHDDFDPAEVDNAFEAFGSDRIVIKPVVGANADDTFVLERGTDEATIRKLASLFRDRRHFIQPFLERVRDEGEYSLFFFGGEYSHAIRKRPRFGDFRTQEEHGADILHERAPAGLPETAARILDLVEPAPVYARADFVRDPDDRFLLMELELVEPSLYFRADEDSAGRFAAAMDAHARTSLQRTPTL